MDLLVFNGKFFTPNFQTKLLKADVRREKRKPSMDNGKVGMKIIQAIKASVSVWGD